MAFKVLLFVTLTVSGSAHMLLKEPKPFPTNNSPLEENGSNYPCKVTSFVAESRAEYPIGSTQTLRFTGSAVHGGGSCQVAITYDKNPTKQSAFKVIHSIEGGCPAKGVAGNLPSNPSGDAPDGYDFKIPTELPAGDAINRIGNREMYMNCAPIKITGGSGGSMSTFSKLPDIMVANIGSKMCKVAEGADVKFPNPGSSVSSFSSSGQLQDMSQQPGCAYNYIAGNGGPPVATTEAPVDSNAPPAFAEPPAASKPPPTVAQGGFAEKPATPGIPASAVTAIPSTAAAGDLCVEKTFRCTTGYAYQMCINGAWSAEAFMMRGTKCTLGVGKSLRVSSDLSVATSHACCSSGGDGHTWQLLVCTLLTVLLLV